MNENRSSADRLARLKIFAVIATLAFIVTLAWVVGNRLSDEALSVLAGAVCGVGAAIPTSLLIVAVSRRREEPQTRAQAAQAPYPPVVVVAPPGHSPSTGDWRAPYASMTAPTERQFTVVGGGDGPQGGMSMKRNGGYDERYS